MDYLDWITTISAFMSCMLAAQTLIRCLNHPEFHALFTPVLGGERRNCFYALEHHFRSAVSILSLKPSTLRVESYLWSIHHGHFYMDIICVLFRVLNDLAVNGKTHAVDLNCKEEAEICEWLDWLRTRSGNPSHRVILSRINVYTILTRAYWDLSVHDIIS